MPKTNECAQYEIIYSAGHCDIHTHSDVRDRMSTINSALRESDIYINYAYKIKIIKCVTVLELWDYNREQYR